jgi:phage shock protein A
MLNDIRKLFRKSVEAFRAELGRKEPEDHVADLLMGMRRELVAARAAIPEFETAVIGARAELARERDGLQQCERRRALAERIGDAETVRIANEFAAKHREKIEVLDQKVTATVAELALHRREVEEMTRRYQEADANRFALLAQLRRAAASERMRSTGVDGGTFAEFDRMEERVERDSAYVDAFDELGDSPPAPRDTSAERAALEERLRELKRRSGQAE